MSSTSDKHFEKRDAQTMLKHLLLKEYVKNWGEAIGLASNSKNIRFVHFVDCFAGRGEFKDGTDASPRIAINTLQDMQFTFRNQYQKFKSDFHIHAIELKKEYTDILKAQKPYSRYPNQLHIYQGKFEEKVNTLLDKTRGCPALYFIDPFGYTGVYMDDIVKIVNQRSHEVLINVMSYSIVRNTPIENNREQLLKFFGLNNVNCSIKEYIELVAKISEQETKKHNSQLLKLEDKIINLYIEQIRKKSNRQLYFLKKRIHSQVNPQIYFHLLFVTGHPRGLLEMKDAMVNYENLRDDEEEKYIMENGVEKISIFGDLFSEKNEYQLYNYDTFVNDFKRHFNNKTTSYAEIVLYFLEHSPIPFNSKYNDKTIYSYIKRIVNEAKFIECYNKSFKTKDFKKAAENIITVNIKELDFQTSLF